MEPPYRSTTALFWVERARRLRERGYKLVYMFEVESMYSSKMASWRRPRCSSSRRCFFRVMVPVLLLYGFIIAFLLILIPLVRIMMSWV